MTGCVLKTQNQFQLFISSVTREVKLKELFHWERFLTRGSHVGKASSHNRLLIPLSLRIFPFLLPW